MNMLNVSADIGIIGGADGPTAVLVSRSGPSWLIPALFVAALALIALSVWQARKKK